jgi:hypothetical protein
MRLWTVHPRYLDARGLVAVWREALLAKAVLQGRTSGYRHHPQLARFRFRPDPVAALNTYLVVLQEEARRRGYRFDRRKTGRRRDRIRLPASRGQLMYEWSHLLRKLRQRSPERTAQLSGIRRPQAHPMFRVIAGRVAPWERVARVEKTRAG